MEPHRIPMYRHDDVVGYIYATEHYCDGICILRALNAITQEEYDAAEPITGVTVAFDGAATVEGALDVVAKSRDIDRYQPSFDSGDFPHVVMAGDEGPDYCPRCAVCGGVLSSFDPSNYDTESDN